MFRFYFSPHGRVSRREIWMKFLLPCGGFSTLTMLANMVVAATGMLMLLPLTSAISSIVGLVMIWPGFAVSIKRFHDRNMSGWWTLVFFAIAGVFTLVMLVGIWAGPMARLFGAGGLGIVLTIQFVILYVLKGGQGPNRFGPDPLDPDAKALANNSNAAMPAHATYSAFDQRADAAIAEARQAMANGQRAQQRKNAIMGRKPDPTVAPRPYVQGVKPAAFGRRKGMA